MAIFTSRYSNKELRNDGYYPVGISVGAPRFPLGYEEREHCYALAPKRYMLDLDFDPYKAEYFKKLEDLGTGKIVSMVRGLEARADAEGKKLVLLCFEDIRVPSQWCHRTLFAEWWKEKTGEIIEELIDNSIPKGATSKQAPKPMPEEPDPQITMF